MRTRVAHLAVRINSQDDVAFFNAFAVHRLVCGSTRNLTASRTKSREIFSPEMRNYTVSLALTTMDTAVLSKTSPTCTAVQTQPVRT